MELRSRKLSSAVLQPKKSSVFLSHKFCGAKPSSKDLLNSAFARSHPFAFGPPRVKKSNTSSTTVSKPPSTQQIGNKPTPLTEYELKLQKIVNRRREQRRKLNRTFAERTGESMTIIAFDRVKRVQSENDELDENLESMLQTVRDLQTKFKLKLEKREMDIASGAIDPEEPLRKENARQMSQWLSAVPSLLEHYEEKKKDWATNDRNLNNLTTVFNYTDQGNNSGAVGAVAPEVQELPNVIESSGEETEGDSSDEENEGESSDSDSSEEEEEEIEEVDA